MAGIGRKRRPIDTRLLVILLAVCVCTVVFAAVQLATGLRPYNEAGREYDELHRAYAPQPTAETPADAPSTGPALELGTAPATTASPADINPDYVGWLEIAGTDISYPVAQGADNDKYLTTTFTGEQNKLGAIFLDARCEGAFDAPHAIVYGHNAKDSSMFGSLHLLERDSGGNYPDITVTLPDGEALTYRVFAVRQTDIHDPAYRLNFADAAELTTFAAEISAPQGGPLPEDATQILTLSTCADGGNKDARLLVLAAREQP